MSEEVKAYSNNSQKRSAVFALFIELGIAAIVIVAVLIALSYFNIISLERINGIFGLLPVQERQEEVSTEELLNVGIESPDALPFAPCPFESTDLCLRGVIIDNGEEFYGIGYSGIPQGTEVKSVMKGNITVREEEGRNVITIEDGLGGQNAILSLVGEVTIQSGSKNVEAGEPIGLVNGSGVDGDALVVSFRSNVNNEYVRVRIGEDGGYVHNRM